MMLPRVLVYRPRRLAVYVRRAQCMKLNALPPVHNAEFGEHL